MAQKFTANIASYILSKLESNASNIKMNGTRSAGTSENMARADHIHPSDTSKLDSSEFITFSDSVDNALSGKASSTHTHGDLTKDGKLGSTPNKPVITTTSGKITTGSFGTGANTFCQGNDPRLSNARTPTAHATNSTTYGGGTASNYGHVKLSDSYGSSDGTASDSVGASSKAVYDAYTKSQVLIMFKNGSTLTSTTHAPDNIRVSHGTNLYAAVTNGAGDPLAGSVLFVINNTSYKMSLNDGVSEGLPINFNAGATTTVYVFYYNAFSQCMGSAAGKLIVV